MIQLPVSKGSGYMAQQQRQIVTSREASESASRRQILHTPKEAADKIAHLWNSLIRWTAFLPREESGETSQVLLRANSKLRDRCSALHSEVRPIFDQTATRLRTRPNSSRRDVIPTESQQPRRARVIVPRRSGDGVTTSSLGLVHIKDSVSREVPLASKQPVLPTGGNSNRVARTRSWRRLLGFGQAFEGSDGTSVIMPERLETCCVENVDIPTIPFGRFKKLNDGTVIFVTKDCERDKEKRARNTVCEASVEENSEILPADKRRRHEDARAAYQVDSYAENRELAQNIAQLEGDEATVTADNDDNESLYDVEELREMMRDVNGEEWFLIKWLVRCCDRAIHLC